MLVYGVQGTNFFKAKSPKLRATASTPSTRFLNTKPPAFSMRATSSGSLALWSCGTKAQATD